MFQEAKERRESHRYFATTAGPAPHHDPRTSWPGDITTTEAVGSTPDPTTDNPQLGADTFDALIVFGATGRLAHKQIFPALPGHGKTWPPPVTVMGVAGSAIDDDQTKGAMLATASRTTAVWTSRLFSQSFPIFCTMVGEPATARHLPAKRKRRSAPRLTPSLYYPAIPTTLFAAWQQGGWQTTGLTRCAHWLLKAVRARRFSAR